VRKFGVGLAAAAGSILGLSLLASVARPARAQDDAGASRAIMTCERAEAPGRVHCDVEARVAPGESITWGDVVISRTPAFAAALRGRIGPHDATSHQADSWRWALALVAREKGTGDVEGRVRLVVCKAGTCAPRELGVVGHVVVGE
jgi:hypothetical protein